MDWLKIELQQRDRIEEIRKNADCVLLSHSFYTLLLWQETMRLSLYLEEDFFVVKYGLAGENSYFCPCGNIEKTRKFIEEYERKKDFQLFYIDEKRKNWLEEQFPEKLQLEYDRGSCEYIYDRQSHLLKQGKKYERIRREIHRLELKYRLSAERLTNENLSAGWNVIEKWQKQNSEEKVGMIADDYLVAKNVMDYFYALELKGVLIYVDGKPMATAIGGEITQDTYAIWVAKMCERKEGLMFYLLEQLFLVIPSEYPYVNGDDDMNIEGIRIHKRKMKPCRMNEVWRAYTVRSRDGNEKSIYQ